MKRTVILTAALLAVGATAAFSQSAAIGQRQEVMKGVLAATKPVGAMMRGEATFELAKVQAALKTYQEASAKMPSLFPDDSKTGAKTAALPSVWEKKAEFVASFAKFGADAAAAAPKITNEASFKAEWPKVTANCVSCHKGFVEPPKK